MKIKSLAVRLFFLLLLNFAAANAYAGVQEVTVTGIGVHKDIEHAQVMAADYARKRALYEMAQKWHVENLETKMKRLDKSVMAQAVRGLQVIDFKREGDILYTKNVVSVLDTPLKRALKVAPEMAMAAPRGLGVLVVPVFKHGEQLLVWDKKNPLRAPMRRAALTHGNQSVLVPLGDAKDGAEIGTDNVLQARYEQFEPMLKRYAAKEVMVAVFTAPDSKDAPTRVLVNRLFKGGMKPEMLEIKAKKNASMLQRYGDVATTVVHLAAQRAAATAAEQRGALEKMAQQNLVFRFSTMREYGVLSSVLREAPGVQSIRIGSIALQEVRGVLYYEGAAEKIRVYLDKKAVKLHEKGGDWVVSLR